MIQILTILFHSTTSGCVAAEGLPRDTALDDKVQQCILVANRKTTGSVEKNLL